MERPRDGVPRRLRPQGSSSSLTPPRPVSEALRETYSSPLPQNQWSEIPSAYRPVDYVEAFDEPPPGSLRPRPSQNQLRTTDTLPEPLRIRHRPSRHGDVHQRSVSALDHHPHQYGGQYLAYGPYLDAPPRSLTSPGSPARFDQRTSQDEEIPMQVPRTPTYPPSGRRRIYSASGVTDAALEDEREFRLFVEATAGLGPIESLPLRRPSSGPDGLLQPRTHNGRNTVSAFPVSGRPDSSHGVDTPTTLQAYQHLAQMPAGAGSQQLPQHPGVVAGQVPEHWAQRIPRRSISPYDDDDLLPPDDELPDYAQSQAEAQAAQRAEATRRAQELQRRWQMSGGRRGDES